MRSSVDITITIKEQGIIHELKLVDLYRNREMLTDSFDKMLVVLGISEPKLLEEPPVKEK